MKTPNFIVASLVSLAFVTLGASAASAGAAIIDLEKHSSAKPGAAATVPDSEPPALFHLSRASGPRVGFTFALDDGETYQTMQENGMGRMVSQFGWHFEREVTPIGGGPQFLTQVIPLFGGVEYGKFIPTLTLALGLRLASGTEFGIGPSFTLANSQGEAKSGLMIGVGRSIRYSGVSIPLNLAVSTNNEGTRVTLLAGYAVHRATR